MIFDRNVGIYEINILVFRNFVVLLPRLKYDTCLFEVINFFSSFVFLESYRKIRFFFIQGCYCIHTESAD